MGRFFGGGGSQKNELTQVLLNLKIYPGNCFRYFLLYPGYGKRKKNIFESPIFCTRVGWRPILLVFDYPSGIYCLGSSQ